MAVALDRRPVTASAVPRTRPGWRTLVVMAAASGTALLALVWMQVQQLERLNAALRNTNAQRVVQMHRQETEYLQLREQWQRALDTNLPFDQRALTLRYDIWVGRVAMLRHETAMRRTAMNAAPRLDDILMRVDRFVRQADAALADKGSVEDRRHALALLHPELLALGEPMHDLSLAASHLATEEQTTRNHVLKRYTRVTLALTGFLTLLVMIFAGLSLRQMRLLSRRHDALQILTADLNAARSAAEASNQAKSQFLANMSHEIRTPFQGLLGMLSMLRDTGLDARQIDYLRTATESADHLLAVLNDILDMSQLEAGRLQLSPLPVTLRSLLQDVDALMRPQATSRHLALHVDAEPSVPERVRLDPTRVKQVLFNLLSNAIKFSDRGSVDLDLRLQHDEAGRDQLLFVVTDTGRGMDEATMARLFNRFERGDAAPTETVAGSGLGLEISRSLARLMGGDLQVSSVPRQGSQFSFTVPLDPVVEGEKSSPPREPDQGAPLQLDVLVAEDHPVNRQVMAALLSSMGHRTYFVPSGDEAIAAVKRQRFDLVLMDLHMPGLDGIEATRLIRALPERGAATVPIVALTADAFTETRERCLVAGMNSFLTKPVGREKLGALLRQLFGSHAGIDVDAGDEATPLRAEFSDADVAPLIDTAAVARTLDLLTPPRYAQVLADYLDQAPSTVDRLRHAVRDAQPLDLRVHAHATRGAALNLGLAALAATAEALQNGAAHLPAHEIALLVQRFDDQLGATRAAALAAGLLPSAVSTD
jgi:two-component system, sensor histidine kinase